MEETRVMMVGLEAMVLKKIEQNVERLTAENDALDHALADEMARHETLVALCNRLIAANGHNAVDFYAVLARIGAMVNDHA